LTNELVEAASKLIDEVESYGGMTKAIQAGIPKMRIEGSATRRQALIDRGDEVIVGVNNYQLEHEPDVDVLVIDNTSVRESQVARLQQIRSTRSAERVERALTALMEAARSGEGNLLALAVECARERATVGEISEAMASVFTRYEATTVSIEGVYASQYEHDDAFVALRSRIEAFEQAYGRRPRILVAKLGQDGHDRGAKVIATSFADIGFDVDIGPLFATPEEVARLAADNDVHVVGVSSQAAGHLTLVPQLFEALKAERAENVIVVVGGVIPPKDVSTLEAMGVAAVFGPGTKIILAAEKVLNAIESRGARS
jgi:methylmalonyl-CoA mutase